MVMRIRLHALLALAAAGLLLAQTPQAPAAAVKPPSNLNQLMRGLFFINSNVVFATQRVSPTEIKRAEEPSGATDPLMGVFNGWEAVETAALMLSEGADLLMTPGRVCSNGRPVPVDAPDWAVFAQQVRDASKIALDAARAKADTDKMLDIADTLNMSCVNCHNRYRGATRCVAAAPGAKGAKGRGK
jgi:hypothetical protein